MGFVDLYTHLLDMSQFKMFETLCSLNRMAIPTHSIFLNILIIVCEIFIFGVYWGGGGGG